MREKLIELIQSAVDGCATYWAGLIADNLIANGVTFATDNNVGDMTPTAKDTNVPSKRIPVTERLPDKGVIVLVSDGSDYPETAELVLRDSGRLIWEDGNFREVEHITHWVPLPEPPKGE